MSAENQHHGQAIGLLMIGVCGGVGLDVVAKWLLATYPLDQFIFLRSVFGVSMFLMISGWYGGFGKLRTRRIGAHLLRTLMACGTMFGFFYSLQHIPLVNALTLAFVAPLIVVALSVPILGEAVGWRRWAAVLVGFLGALVVLRPGPDMFTPPAIGVLIAAFCYAGLAVSARKLSETESTLSLAVYVVLGPMIASAFRLSGDFVMPSSGDWMLFAVAGACSVVAWIGLVGGYSRAPPSLLAPFEYTALIGAAAAGYYIWGEVPDRWVVIGGIVIVASGLFIAHREVASMVSARYSRLFTPAGAIWVRRRLRRRRNHS